MSLFKLTNNNLSQIKKTDFRYEKDLQEITENNLEAIFNLKFVETEFQVDDLRIDTLAFDDESKSFVIIEYKRNKNYTVIDQGYSYLSLLLNNKAEFVLKYNQKFDSNLGKEDFDFSQTKVLFVAPNFTKYQLKSVEFKDLPFELCKVTKFDNDLILYDKINVSENKASIKEIKTPIESINEKVNREIVSYKESDHFSTKPEYIAEFYENIKDAIENNFDDINVVPLKHYIAFKTNNKNIISLIPRKDKIQIFISMKIEDINDPNDLVIDVSGKDHWGTGNCEVNLFPGDDLNYFISLFRQSYEDKL